MKGAFKQLSEYEKNMQRNGKFSDDADFDSVVESKKKKSTLYLDALFIFLDNVIGSTAHATAMKMICLSWCNFFLLDQKLHALVYGEKKQILWYLIDLLFVDIFCCTFIHVMQCSSQF